MSSPTGVLFLCVANSARSQMAEAIARELAPPGVAIFSAGSRPSSVSPLAVEALAEIGLDAAGSRSKGVDDVPRERIGTVVTLCAEEVCPAWLASARRLHWPLADPADATGPHAERLEAFRSVRDELVRRLRDLFES